MKTTQILPKRAERALLFTTLYIYYISLYMYDGYIFTCPTCPIVVKTVFRVNRGMFFRALSFFLPALNLP